MKSMKTEQKTDKDKGPSAVLFYFLPRDQQLQPLFISELYYPSPPPPLASSHYPPSPPSPCRANAPFQRISKNTYV